MYVRILKPANPQHTLYTKWYENFHSAKNRVSYICMYLYIEGEKIEIKRVVER